MPLVFQSINHRLERLVIFIRPFLHAHHHVAIHLDEPAIAIPGKPLVLRGLGQGVHGFVVQAKIQDRVHHSRHRIPRARTHRNQQRHGRLVTELCAHDLFDELHAVTNLGLQRFRVALFVLVIVGADLGRDREPGRDRQADPAHLGQVCPLAAEQRLHAAIAVGLLVSK